MTPLHVADQPDYLAIEAEWRNEWVELMKPMTLRLRALKHEFFGAGDGQTFEAIYNGTMELRADLDVLKERQTSILDKLKVNRDAWHDAVSTRTGTLEELDAQVTVQERDMSSKQKAISALEMQRRELEGSASSLQDDISWAKYSLKTIQDQELVLRHNFKDYATSALSDREQKHKDDFLVWKRQVDNASDEQQPRQDKLRKLKKDTAERRLALVEAEEISKTTKSRNDNIAKHLKIARSILQNLG